MAARLRSLAVFAIVLTDALGSPPVAAQEAMTVSQSGLIRNLLPTVVNITATVAPATLGDAGPEAQAGASKPPTLNGSGFIIDPNGLIATNEHVLTGAYRIMVTFSDGRTALAELVAMAPVIDIAVIRVHTQHKLAAVRWGDSDKVEIGDPVIAIGNPLGIGMSVTTGTVSALNRNINSSPFDRYIQTDAAINHGNSGGPLFTRNGEVIGMNTALISPTRGSAGLGFAQPSDDVKAIVERLIHHRWSRPGWAGLTVEGVTPELAEALGMPAPEGAIVASLTEGGPAAVAGMQVGDVVLRFGDRTPTDVRELNRLIALATVDQTVKVTVLRDGQERIIPITIRVWPHSAAEIAALSRQAAAPAMAVPRDLGLGLSAITPDVREEYGLNVAQTGLVITGIAAGTDAATRGLSQGDVILRVQNELVQTPQQAQAVIDAARAQHRPFVATLVLRKGEDRPDPIWIVLRVSAP